MTSTLPGNSGIDLSNSLLLTDLYQLNMMQAYAETGMTDIAVFEFFVRKLPDRLDAARQRLADFLGTDPESLAVVPNATTGVNAILRSLDFGTHDELLTTDHEYNACHNALDYVVDSWQYVDLSDLGSVRSLEMTLASSDTSGGYMNTPGYFAMDNLVVPEPCTLALLAIGALALRKRRTRK